MQLNHMTYAECGGREMEIPGLNDPSCGGCVQVLGDYVGDPVTDSGLFRGYNIIKQAGGPVGDQIPLLRLHDSGTGNTYHILGTEEEYRAGGPMPVKADIPAVVINEDAVCNP